MGNENSTGDPNTKGLKNDLSLGFCDNLSSYQGIKSDTSEENKQKSTSDHQSEKTTTEQTVEMIQDYKIPVVFEWEEGGNNVVLTGAFVKWQQFFQMTKTPKGTFELQLSLEPGIHQFKYVVDNQWRCSRKYSTKDDGSYNINNYLDTSTIPKPPQEIKECSRLTQSLHSSKQADMKDGYSYYVPKRTEMNTETSVIPLHYQKPFNINLQTNQSTLGKPHYIQSTEGNVLSENNSFKTIFIPPHVNINHQISSCIKEKRIRTCIIFKTKHKYTTVIYYSKNFK